MKKKIALAAALIAFAAVAAFAEVGTYIKGAVGYGYRWGMDWTSTAYGVTYDWSYLIRLQGYDYSGIENHLFIVVPTFGIEPWRGNSNAFLRGISLELSLGLGFGKASTSLSVLGLSVTEDHGASFIIEPRIMAVYTHRAGMIAPYLGVGVSVPIAIIPEFGGNDYNGYISGVYMETPAFQVGINGNVMAGLGFQVTPSVMPFIEADFGFGTDMRIDGRIGLAYRFGM